MTKKMTICSKVAKAILEKSENGVFKASLIKRAVRGAQEDSGLRKLRLMKSEFETSYFDAEAYSYDKKTGTYKASKKFMSFIKKYTN